MLGKGIWLKGVEALVRVLLGLLFLYAGALKILDPIAFLDAVRSFQLLGDPWAAWVAMFLPWVEIAAGGGLVLRRFYPGSLVTILGLLLFFLAAISISWARGLDISCGCFGEQTEGVSYPQLIIRDLGMIAMAVFLLARESQALPTDSRTMAPR